MKYAHAKVTRHKDLGPPAPNVDIVNKVDKNGQSALGTVAERLLFRISTLSADSLESAPFQSFGNTSPQGSMGPTAKGPLLPFVSKSCPSANGPPSIGGECALILGGAPYSELS